MSARPATPWSPIPAPAQVPGKEGTANIGAARL
jgi:hypothetical protein